MCNESNSQLSIILSAGLKVAHKNISRQYLIDKATSIINAPYIAVEENFYQSTEWIKTRDEYIKRNPFCELCLSEGKDKQGDDVHHITPLTAGGEPFLEANLIALCDSCHSGIHASGGIAVELSIDNLFGFGDHINNFTAKLKNVDNLTLSRCKVGDNVVLIREQKIDRPQGRGSVFQTPNVSVINNNGEYIGDLYSADVNRHYLAYDIVHGSEVSATIDEIITKNNKTQCFIKISKSELDWNEIDRFNAKENEISELIHKAKQLEKTDCEKSIQAYQEATKMLIQLDRECDKYPMTWRTVRIPIYRLSLILEKQKKYKECLEEIESYQAYDDKVWLYAGEKEKIEKRKSKILKLLQRSF